MRTTIEQQFSARRLTDARRRGNYTREQVAYALRVSVQTVANWEQGRNAPHVDRLPELARFLNVRVGDLFEDGAHD